MTYDLAIIGGGPAGVAAGVYAARKRLKTALIVKEFGGQSTVSEGIQNWIGTINIPGADLAKNLKAHLEAYKSDVVSIFENEWVTTVTKDGAEYVVTTDKKTYKAKTILLTMGSQRRKLEVPGAAEFENKGLTYCASCDGPLFTDQDVVVVGGGNAAFESAAQLMAYCKTVTILSRGTFRADPITIQKILNNPNVKGIENTTIIDVQGKTFVTGISYKTATAEPTTLPVTGIFIEIGLIPNTDLAKDIVSRNSFNQIVTDPRTQRTSEKGMWAAGDCTDGLYHQNNIAAGDAVRALEDIYQFLQVHS